MYKLENPRFHRRFRRNYVYRVISLRQNDIKTNLCDRKMPNSTYQAAADSKVRASSRSLRSSSHQTDIERSWLKNWQNHSLDRFIYSVTMVTVSAQETKLVRCKQSSGSTGKLFHGSTETFQRRWKTLQILAHKRCPSKAQELRVVKQAAWLQTDEE